MRKLAFIAIVVLSIIAYMSNQITYGQVTEQIPLKQRIQQFENTLTANKYLYKELGVNNCKANGKIIQKITTNESFEIVAFPLLEADDINFYPDDFKAALFSPSNLKLSEIASKTGLRLSANVPESSNQKKYRFEFFNPNNQGVKVKFYFLQKEPEE